MSSLGLQCGVSSGTVYSFGPFQLDTRSKQLTRDGERVPISDRQVSVLQHLLANAGSIASKDTLITRGRTVTDNSPSRSSAWCRSLATA